MRHLILIVYYFILCMAGLWATSTIRACLDDLRHHSREQDKETAITPTNTMGIE